MSMLLTATVSLTLAAGCTSGDDASSSRPATTIASDATASTTTAAPETTAASTAPASTAAPTATAAFPDPTAAGAALFAAWTKSDRAGAGALGLAPPAELDKLFAAVPLPAAKNRGCDDGDFGSASCFFGNGAGGVNVGLTPAAAGGWSISSIDPFG